MSEGPGFAAFDAACVQFEQSLSNSVNAGVSVPPTSLELDRLNEIVGQLNSTLENLLPSTAAARARQILDMYRVMKAARGLVSDVQAAEYASKIHLLHIEYDVAANAARRGHNYDFSAALKRAAGTLTDALNRVRKNTATMNTVASAMTGAAALIGALV